MVLKVVRGKILETLELTGLPDACRSVLELADVEISGAFPFMMSVPVKLSKILDYL